MRGNTEVNGQNIHDWIASVAHLGGLIAAWYLIIRERRKDRNNEE